MILINETCYIREDDGTMRKATDEEIAAHSQRMNKATSSNHWENDHS